MIFFVLLSTFRIFATEVANLPALGMKKE